MRKGIVALVVVASSAWAGTIDEVVTDVTKRFTAAIKCGPGDRDLQRAWCAVTRAGREAPKLPSVPTTYFGLTAVLPKGRSVTMALRKSVTPAALHLGPGGARISGLEPDGGEGLQLSETVASAAKVLRGESKAVVVPRRLAEYLDSQRAGPMHPVTVRGNGADFTGALPSRLLASHLAWVVVEQTSDEMTVNVFPIAPIERR
jgi:hypothetical protein